MNRNGKGAVALAEVLAARQVVKRHAWRTPLVPSAALGKVAGCQAYLKMECWQHTGSFKVRGALSKLSALSPDEWERGLPDEVIETPWSQAGINWYVLSSRSTRYNASYF